MPRGAAAVEPPLPRVTTKQAVGRVDALLEEARRGLSRLSPQEAAAAVAAGALLVDTRTAQQRSAQGELPGAVVVDRTVLEWRLDPTSPDRIPEASGPDLHVVVVCRQGYSSSLAAASLQRLGLHRATDVIGGVEGWLAAGLPVHRGPADVRE
jgi:rhodanese-related sulfurtransferase